MARIEFDGQGARIPAIALPPFGSDGDLPPTVLAFTESTDFSVQQYRELGFTHFEVWCVGAAGGRGGDASQGVITAVEEVLRPVPQDVWNLQLESVTYDDFFDQEAFLRDNVNPNWWGPVTWNPYGQQWGYPPGYLPPVQLNRLYHADPNTNLYQPQMPDGSYSSRHYLFTDPNYVGWSRLLERFGLSTVTWKGWQGRYVDLYEYKNSGHLKLFTTYRSSALMAPSTIGGAGGGGGMHKVAGALEDLADVVPVVVGKAGQNGAMGHTYQNGPYTTRLGSLGLEDPNQYTHPYKRRQVEIYNYFKQYTTAFAGPADTFDNPQVGQDGGASSFAGNICQASGGKGGKPAMIWDGAKFVRHGHGGDGGVGGRTAAGGGALGATAEGANGSDGIWRPETGIGAGGGGGRAAGEPKQTGSSGPAWNPYPIMTQTMASAGGQGSYSFADTSVYGQRQTRQPVSYIEVKRSAPVLAPDGSRMLESGQLIFTPVTKTDQLIVPGGGGGARPAKNLKHGSLATGYSPDGVVVIRLTKIT